MVAVDWVRMDPVHQGIDTLIVLAPDQASFYEFLKPRQGASGRTLVVLDRRRAEPSPGAQSTPDAAQGEDRRRRHPEAALALMSVLGFMILHRDEGGWSA